MDLRTSPDVFLGVDGGGTKTEFVLIDAAGNVRARYQGATSYYLQIGFDGLEKVLGEGIAAVAAEAKLPVSAIRYAFFGLPAYGEDSLVQDRIDALPETVLRHRRYRCGNDMVCGWAGSLACEDGINIVAGTGSIGYGERQGVSARCGGWGEVFGDEGSAYWIAIQGLNVFSRMSDGRLPVGPLHRIFKEHFEVTEDLDVCGRVMSDGAASRDRIAALSRLVSTAAEEGDAAALKIFDRAAEELADIIDTIRVQLGYVGADEVRLSYSGGVFRSGEILLQPLRRHLASRFPRYALVAPQFAPGIGAALYAARLAGNPLGATALARLPKFSD
ncbi:N-acetylglucosamine kinase [Rhizomicrobium electricum]|uniref:BadF/BadG/BcrA/BcrD ATPase family protein n=1 Tax=Rhizomicrobium electricum TaxID=480070 RepID=A0ABN1ERM1_9PROT|nr:BadF/BadG/BcrA/BcrD ATPase family protein [Rhizomicrobium electricum]NIJ49022.1 N-acetylglucosamine kinase-like BadF-type ATPase [Rhizomicrobium electricum]